MTALTAQYAVRYLQCPLCKALPRNRCSTVRGKNPGTPTVTHEARSRPFHNVWLDGLADGGVYGGKQALWQAANGLQPLGQYEGKALIDWLHRLAEARG